MTFLGHFGLSVQHHLWPGNGRESLALTFSDIDLSLIGVNKKERICLSQLVKGSL